MQGAPASGVVICLVASRTASPRLSGEWRLCNGPAPSRRRELAIAAPRAVTGSGPVRTVSMSCTSRSAWHAVTVQQHEGSARHGRPAALIEDVVPPLGKF